MKKIFSFLFVLFCILISSSCSNKNKLPSKKLTIVRADGSEVTLNAEITRTPEQRNHGFMERKNIPDGTGMIFIFEKDQVLSFWMKNTPHPLSIAFIDSHGKIRDIFDMKPFSLESINSTVSTRYALEVPQGWFEKENIKVGDKLSLDF